MVKVILKRVLQIIPTLFVVVLFAFVVTRVLPGDPAAAMMGEQYTVEELERVREEMGFNEPILKQFSDYFVNILHGDFGRSYSFRVPAMEIIGQRLPNTLLLTLPSLAIAIAIGTSLGVVSAQKQGRLSDYILTMVSLFGVSAPVFWVALMLVALFGVNLGWLPVYGMVSISDGFIDWLRHLILPWLCLALIPIGTYTRITRSSMIDALGSDSVRALRARGVGERRVVWKHAFKNALPALITMTGIQLAGSFAGALLIESIFTWPGMGSMIQSAIDNRDYALVQATVLVVALAFVIVNLVADLCNIFINPKIADEVRKGRN